VSTRWDEGRCWDWIADCMHWRGTVLHGQFMHWCNDWDGLPVDETTPDEFDCCYCWGDEHPAAVDRALGKAMAAASRPGSEGAP
jgi:hypothetical protein